MNAKKYNEKMKGLIIKDFELMKKMIKNIDPAEKISIETLATLVVIQNFTSAMIKNIQAMEQFNVLEKVVSSLEEELGFEPWEVDEEKPKKFKKSNDTLYA